MGASPVAPVAILSVPVIMLIPVRLTPGRPITPAVAAVIIPSPGVITPGSVTGVIPSVTASG